MLSLICAALHGSIPSMTPGNIITLSRASTGGLVVHLPGTPGVLGALAEAMKDGALIPHDWEGPEWEELKSMIEADRDRFLAKADAIEAGLRRPMDRAS